MFTIVEVLQLLGAQVINPIEARLLLGVDEIIKSKSNGGK